MPIGETVYPQTVWTRLAVSVHSGMCSTASLSAKYVGKSWLRF